MDDPGIWARRLEGAEGETMLVGHLPHLGRLASLLICGGENNAVHFRMGGVLRLKRGEDRNWAVQWMVTPEMLGG
jgi:phosphohistidine phosphatase